jgi:hypothetical protein
MLWRFQILPVRTRLRIVGVVSLLAGVLLTLLLRAMPSRISTRHAYCTLCAMHSIETEEASLFHFDGMPLESLFVKRSTITRGGVLHRLLSPAMGEHRHVWIDPAPFVPPTNPARKLQPPADFQQSVAEAEVSELERLEESPHLVSLLDQAMHDDRARALRLVQKILDPAAHVGVDAIGLLDRTTPWENRWMVVESFFELYRCSANDVSVSCRMHVGTTDLIVLARTAGSVQTGGIDWSHWVPEGMAPPPGDPNGHPTSFAVVTN